MFNRTFRIASLFITSLYIFSTMSPSAIAGPKVRVAESQDFVVLYQFTGNKMKIIDAQGKKKKLMELSYKFVNRANKPKQLFGDSGWVAVRFQDKKGFDLVKEPVSFSELSFEREYYGSLWLEKKKAKKLANVDVTSEKIERIHEIQRIKQLRLKPVDDVLQARRADKVEQAQFTEVKEKKAQAKRKTGFWAAINPFDQESKVKRAAKREARAQKKAMKKAERKAEKESEVAPEGLSKKELKAQKREARKAEKLAKKKAKAEAKARKKAEKEAERQLKKEKQAAEKLAKEKKKQGDDAQDENQVNWETTKQEISAVKQEVVEEAVPEAEEVSVDELLEQVEEKTELTSTTGQPVSYEGTEATTTLEPDENRLTEQDIAETSAEHEAKQADNPADAQIEGAVTNDEVTLTLDALEQQPPTIKS